MILKFIFLPSVMLSGIMFPSNMLPKVLGYIGVIFPATWGYKLVIGNLLRFNNLYPLIIIFIISIIVSIYKLNKIGFEK